LAAILSLIRIVMSAPLLKRLSGFAGKPIVARSLIGVLLFLLLFGLFGYFALPGIIQSQAEKILSEKLQRKASIGKVEVSPFALAVTVHDFKLMEPQGDAVFAAFDTLSINLSAQSAWRLAPVVQAVRLTRPYLHLVRVDANRYNIDDLLALIANQPPSPQPAHFSIHNIQLEGGRIEFEDRPTRTSHTVADLRIGVPFISSLPSQVEVFVQPLLSAQVDGSPLLLKGKALPFADAREAAVELNLDDLDLTRYLDYLPFRPAFKVPGARLDLHMRAHFLQPKDKPPELTLSGTAAIKSLRLIEPNGKPVLTLPELAVTLDRTNIFGNRVDVARVALTGLNADVTRDGKGRLSLLRLLPGAGATGSAPASATPATAASAVPTMALGELVIRGAALRYRDEQPNQPLDAGVEKFDLALRKVTLDPGRKSVHIGEVASGSAAFLLRHEKPATAAVTVTNAADPVSDSAKPSTLKTNTPYRISVDRIAIENWSARLEDRSLPKAAVTQLAPISLDMQNLSTASGAHAGMTLKAAVNKTGQLAVNGTLGLAPFHADLALDLKAVDILPLQPYVTDRVNLLLTRANLSGKGRLQLDQGSDGAFNGGYKGDLTLGNLATLDKLSGSDFLRWKSLYVGGIDVRLRPFALAVDQIALSDFFARVIIDPSGRINLQDIVNSHAGDHKSLTEPAGDAPAAAVPPVRNDAPAIASAKPAAKTVETPPIKIRKLTLQGGKVRFTDNFIKPNYSANLMDLGGVVQGLSSDAASSASVDLRGQVNSAPLSVAGRINPLKGDLSLDLQARVRDMEMAPLSPYSGRYIGYGIEKGKISFEAAYQIQHRKLTAQNRLILDQLTFGDKIDNPGATSLPVHLAVALLRDRNGVIDINLPIAGSLDDPQFSIGGIIVKVIGNLITKAVTAPFSLLGSLFGGGEELSWLAFDPGRAVIPPAGEARLKSLAKALVERPALRLEITGRTGTEAEREGLKRASIERKVRALKAKELAARGESVPAGGVVVTPAEYPALLTKVYKAETFPKPRNLIGLQKSLPVEEMEKLMIANTPVSDDDLAALGNRRALVVKDWLVKHGRVPGERIFVVGARPAAADAKEESAKSSASRVDFSLK
jgi:hypothetical protein